MLPPGHPWFIRIGAIQRELRESGKYLYITCYQRRTYATDELKEAELLRLRVYKRMRPGHRDWTTYDHSNSCPFIFHDFVHYVQDEYPIHFYAACGVGKRQVGPLAVNLNHLPGGADIATTFSGGHTIVHKRVMEVMRDLKVTGVEFQAVKHKGRKPTDEWYQLLPKSQVTYSKLAEFKSDPFGLGEIYQCPFGHLVGPLWSELRIERSSWDGSDYVATRQMSGYASEVSSPEVSSPHPEVAISQRLWHALVENKVRGLVVEPARLD